MYARVIAAVVLLGTIAFQTVQAQTPTGTTGTTVNVSGCVAQAGRTGSLADDSGVGVKATPNSAPNEANSAELLNAYLLTNATPATGEGQGADRAKPTSYTLQGHEQEFAQHKGHKAQVTGRLLPAPSAARPADAKAPAPGIERIVVESVRMLSAECPVTKP